MKKFSTRIVETLQLISLALHSRKRGVNERGRGRWHPAALALLVAVVALGGVSLVARGASLSKTNSSSGSVDGDVITRTVQFTSSDFAAGAVIADVDVTVDFAKVSGSCAAPGTGSPFNREIYMTLTSPTGTSITLVEDSLNSTGGTNYGYTYSSNTQNGGRVAVSFDDSAPTLVGGPAPVSGTFRAEESLGAFNSQSPLGSWTLTLGDNAAGTTTSDPLCFYEFSLTIDANQPPVVDDQSFSVDENSPNGTSVGTVVASDPDPNEKLVYSITAGNSNNAFAIDSNTGEIIVNNSSALDYETTPAYTLTVSVTDSSGLSDSATVTITIRNVNEPPVANDSAATTNEDTPDAGNLSGNYSDPDGDALTASADSATSTKGAAVTVSANGDYTYDPTGSATLQALTAGETTTDTFSYTVSDGSLSDSATVVVTVTGVNDSPTADDDQTTILEDSGPTSIVVLSNDSDPDAGESDTLIVSAVSPASNGTTSIAADQKGVIYTPNQDFNGPDSFTYTISDVNGATATATVTVNVTAVNDGPVANNDTGATDEDTVLTTLNVLTNDTDVDGPSLTVTGHDATSSLGASVSITTTGGVSYDPTGAAALQALDAGESLADSFSYTVSDGSLSDTATVTITVSGINDAPVANDDSATTGEDTPVTVQVLDNDSDPEDGTPTVSGASNGSNGTTTFTGSSVTYTPDANFTGTDSFTYTVVDSSGLTAQATVTITVTDVNDGPVANDDTGATDEDTVLTTLNVLTNDTDVDGPSLTVTGHDATSSLGASVSITTTGGVSYDPTGAAALQALDAGESLADSFSYTVSDGSLSDTATVTITVSGINDAPVANDDSATTGEDTPVTVQVLDNDSDPEDGTPTVSGASNGSNGTTTFTGSSVTYTPDANFTGTDSFTYTVVDSSGLTAQATVTITVTDVNDGPVANDDTGATDEDTVLTTLNVLTNDTDVDGPSLTVTGHDATSSLGASVSITTTGGVSYDPTGAAALQALDAGESLADSFSYTVSDGSLSDTATVVVTVTGINDAPVANDDSATTAEETPVTVAVLDNDSDPEDGTPTVSGATNGSNGTTTFTGSSVTYTPNPDFTGTDSFTYTVVDSSGLSAQATVTITVTDVNDGPTDMALSSSTVAENQPSGTVVGTLSTTDADNPNDTHSYSLVGGDTTSFSISGNELRTAESFNYEVKSSYTVTIRVTDAGGSTYNETFTITVTNVNDAPVAQDDGIGGEYVANEGSSVNFNSPTVLANDSDEDGDLLTLDTAPTTSTAGAAITLLLSGEFNYDPTGAAGIEQLSAGQVMTDTFTYTVRDGNGGSDTGTVYVRVTGANDNPTGLDLSPDVMFENAPVGSPIGYFSTTDVDANDAHVYTLVAGTGDTDNALFTIVGNELRTAAMFDYESQSTYSIRVQTDDQQGGTLSQSFVITVLDANEPPVAEDGTASTDEDTTTGGTLTATDPDSGDTLTYSLQSAPTSGATVTISGNGVTGTFTYDPTGSTTLQALRAGESYTDIFQYRVRDQDAASDNGTITMTVTGVNDVPLAVNDNSGTQEGTPVTIDVLANDSDPEDTADGIALEVQSTSTPANGTVTVATDGSTLIYTPNAGFVGTDTFTYTVVDSDGLTATATVTVQVNNVNDVPVATDDTGSTDEDTLRTVAAPGLLSNDSDPDTSQGDTLSAAPATLTTAQGAAVTINADGSYSYDPRGSATLQALTTGDSVVDSFTYTVRDSSGATDTATVRITVGGVNDAPTAVNDSATTAEDTAVTIDVLANDSDVESGALAVQAVGTPANGTADTDNATVTYTPNTGFVGTEVFTYTVVDEGGLTAIATITVEVVDVTYAPDITIAPPAQTITVGETGLYTVTLSEAPSSDLVLTLQSVDPGVASVPPTMTIPAGSLTGTFQVAGNAVGGPVPLMAALPAEAGGKQAFAEITVVEGSGGGGTGHDLFLPIAIRPGAPDLVATFSLNPNKLSFAEGETVEVSVVVTNQGNAPANPFWVDFYMNPDPLPTAPNMLWNRSCSLDPCLGIAWYVNQTLAPGESVTLTSTSGSYSAEHTRWINTFVAGTTDLYVYVDSWNDGVTHGSVFESNEGNNQVALRGLTVTGTGALQNLVLPNRTIPPRPVPERTGR